MKRILLTIFFGLWAISANATVQVKALTGQPVQVCVPSDSNSNCGGPWQTCNTADVCPVNYATGNTDVQNLAFIHPGYYQVANFTNGYVTVGTANLSPSTGGSFSFWYNVPIPTSDDLFGDLYHAYGNTSGAYWDIHNQGSGLVNFEISFRGSGYSIQTNNYTPVNGWNHIVYTYNGSGISTIGNWKGYVNGSAITVTKVSGGPGGSSTTNAIGYTYTNPSLVGDLGCVLFFNVALSPTQVGYLWNGGAGVYGLPSSIPSGDLISGYNFNGNANDIQGVNNGTVVGSLSYIDGFIPTGSSVYTTAKINYASGIHLLDNTTVTGTMLATTVNDAVGDYLNNGEVFALTSFQDGNTDYIGGGKIIDASNDYLDNGLIYSSGSLEDGYGDSLSSGTLYLPGGLPSTGGNPGIQACFDVNNQLCACNACA